MASCQTWTPSSHIRHPWFDNAVMKRKHRDVEPDAADADDAYPSLISTPASSSSSNFNSFSTFTTGASASATNTTRLPTRTHPTKRRRCSTLEHGLAHLSLGGSAIVPPAAVALGSNQSSSSHPTTHSHVNIGAITSSRVQEVPLPAPLPIIVNHSGNEVITEGLGSAPGSGCTSPMAVDLEMFASPLPQQQQQQQHAYTVEEPEELEGRAPEVKMGVVSWYEPEPDRIVITDLDSFTQEAEEEEAEAARLQISINEALLARIRRQHATGETSLTSSSSLSSSSSNTNQALVLFKPLPLSDAELDKVNNAQAKQRQGATIEAERTQKAREAELEQQQRLDEARDEDAMDIEP